MPDGQPNLKAKEAPSKPVVKDKDETPSPPEWRQGRDIKMVLCRIGDSNYATVATSSTKLIKTGLHFNISEKSDDPKYVFTVSIPSSTDGGWVDMPIERNEGDEAQALYNAAPRRVPHHLLPAGCDLEPAPEPKRKKRKKKTE
jgi:hypothetical protein